MKAERKSITQPSDWWEAFQAQAKSEHLTISEWVGECCKLYVKDRRLSERKPAHRPKACIN